MFSTPAFPPPNSPTRPCWAAAAQEPPPRHPNRHHHVTQEQETLGDHSPRSAAAILPHPRPGHLNDSEKHPQGLKTVSHRDCSRRRCQAGEVGAGRYPDWYQSPVLGREGEFERTGSDTNRRDSQSPAGISEVSRFDKEWKSLRQICSHPPTPGRVTIPLPGTRSDGLWDPALPARGCCQGVSSTEGSRKD